MEAFSPFCAGMFDDPSSDPADGVVDVSPALSASGDLADPHRWLAARQAGEVTVLDEACLYLVRLGVQHPDGTAAQFSGVVGANGVAASILTQPATVLVDDDSFAELLVPEGLPLLRASVDGAHVRVWPIRRSGYIETISEAVRKHAPSSVSPFVIATTRFFTLPAGVLFFGVSNSS